MKTRSYPRYVKLPDNNGNFTRVAKAWKFRDSSRIYYFEPLFMLSGGVIVRKDALFEDDDIFSMKGCGFLPCTLKEYRDGCRANYQRYKDEHIFISDFAIACGATEPPYIDKDVVSTKYHI